MSGDPGLYFDVIVAGGGASGMTAACFCAEGLKGRKGRVAVLEKNDVLGKKLSVTGNGKCNISNEKMEASCYNGDLSFVEGLLKEYPTSRVLSWFEKLGIRTVSKNGYLYPMSEQAKSVTEALERELKNLNVSVFKGCTVESITNNGDGFSLCTRDKEGRKTEYRAKRVILSLGGPASVYGATDTGFKVLKGFGINLEEPRPALTALTSSDKILKKMAGVRLQAAVTLSVKGRKYTDTGEIIFNDGNVSGIPVFKISRFVEKDSRPTLIADLLPSLSREEAVSFITGVLRHNPRTTYEQLLRGILNYKAVYYILERNRIDAESIAGSLTDAAAGKLVDLFKNFTLEINGTKGFESAQTSTGGALPSCLDKESLESLKVKGLYITGELVDVDGICGGYNLHFAWASGMKAGKACAESLC